MNDTGNYNFLEFQDPNAKVFQQQSMDQAEAEQQAAADREAIQDAEAPTETAWERGLRQAREMKEKARLRKLAAKEAGSFKDKQMNLSLKEFEDEVENDERYMNVEKYNVIFCYLAGSKTSYVMYRMYSDMVIEYQYNLYMKGNL